MKIHSHPLWIFTFLFSQKHISIILANIYWNLDLFLLNIKPNYCIVFFFVSFFYQSKFLTQKVKFSNMRVKWTSIFYKTTKRIIFLLIPCCWSIIYVSLPPLVFLIIEPFMWAHICYMYSNMPLDVSDC